VHHEEKKDESKRHKEDRSKDKGHKVIKCEKSEKNNIWQNISF